MFISVFNRKVLKTVTKEVVNMKAEDGKSISTDSDVQSDHIASW